MLGNVGYGVADLVVVVYRILCLRTALVGLAQELRVENGLLGGGMQFEKLSQPIPDQANILPIGTIDIIQTSKGEALSVMIVQDQISDVHSLPPAVIEAFRLSATPSLWPALGLKISTAGCRSLRASIRLQRPTCLVSTAVVVIELL